MDAQQLTIEIEADATVGYAAIQNAVPIVRGLRITNKTDAALDGLELLVACEPSFARGARICFERLEAGESRRIAPVDLVPDHAFLADHVESAVGTVVVTAVRGQSELLQVGRPVEVLAYDQWAGTRALPELLAAFCMPNNPAVDLLIGRASTLLRSHHAELSMDGYQSKHRDRVWKQVSAIYSTIAAENLQYSEPPASFGSDGQKIRTPDRILEGRVATCLDLAMLFASCLEQAGLRPILLLKQGHAWVGAWLHETAFATALVDDVQAVRKRVDAGELLVFETTGVAQHVSLRPSLRHAAEVGASHLADKAGFGYAVDVQRARQLKIRPLPSRVVGGAKRIEVTSEQTPVAIEPTPDLPPLDPAALAPAPDAPADTPAARLALWKAKLLDLTLHNKLLNFRPTKASLQLLAPDLAALEDALFERKEFRIREMPPLMSGADPRSRDVHVGRHGSDPLVEHARERLAHSEIVCKVGGDKLDGHLVALHRDARTSLEEGGSNTLYLALGFLRWAEAEHAESTHLAPILLVPVTLQRTSVLSGFRLARHDDETIVNPTLLQMLRHEHELRIAGLDPLPADDKGVDVPRVLQIFRLAIADIPGWEVLEDAFLGIFSFTKYLMWKDLTDRTEQLKANRVVRHLIDRPGERIASDAEGGSGLRLDDTHGPTDLLAPLLSDSSQLEAMRAVDDGGDLVLEGPPGTGKSQTITNLIAHLVGNGKTVLFVSEKITALDVVHRRLGEIGLGPFCLELHSAKARKLEVLQQLGEAMDARAGFDEAGWTREAERLAGLRRELNAVVDELHAVRRNGLTVFDAIGTCIASAGRSCAPMAWADPEIHDRADLERLRETARRIAALAGDVGALHGNALAEIGQTEWSHGWQDELAAALERADAAADHMQRAAATLAAQLPVTGAGTSMAALTAVDALADVLLGAPKLPAGLARRSSDPATQRLLRELATRARARTQQWAALGGAWRDDLARLDAAELRREWEGAAAKWWPSSWFAKRSIATRLMGLRSAGVRPSDADVAAMLPLLAAVNAEDRALATMHGDAQQLLGESYAGTQTDWQTVENLDAWSRTFSDAVARVEGVDVTARQGLRPRLEPLVAEHRNLLTPDSPLGSAVVAFRRAFNELSTELGSLGRLACVDAPLTGPPDSDGALERLRTTLARWRGALRSLQPWCVWRGARAAAIAQNLAGLVHLLERGDVALADAETFFERSYREWWLKRTIDAVPTLRGFSSADHQRKIREFREVDERFQKLTRAFVVARLCTKVPKPAPTVAGADSEIGLLQRERQKQRRHLPVRQLVAGMPTVLPRLKPCLLMSPLSVAQYLDPGHAQFDVVVFDEASQIPVWDAVGAIARGKQVVVVGDPKQLPPTNFFEHTGSTDATDEDSIEDLDSILDECLAIGLERRSLQWHYRSRHESLIHFSNVTYYGSRLITFPSPTTEHAGVRCELIEGAYDRGGSRTNRAEANAIVEHIERHFGGETVSKSLGVVTFNATQQHLIEELLDARRKANPALDRAIAAAVTEPLFVKNLESVQGDERDVILFSITYGRDEAGKLTMNFGPLNRQGGQRRLNVAVSRARQCVIVFSTLRPDDIDVARVGHPGVKDLKAYLEYALRGPRALAEQSSPTGREPDSPFESAVAVALRERGWEVHPQVGCSGYRIDLGVVDPRARGSYLLGIECDGRAYHSGATARDRDRLRQHVLEGLGWKLHRIWSTDWWRDPGREVQRIDENLRALLQVEVAAPEQQQQRAAAGTPAEMPQPVESGAAPEVAQELPVFVTCELRARDAAGFDRPSADAIMREQIAEVIAKEGPVLDREVFKRVAKAWDKRLGARILERIAACVPTDTTITRDGERAFYWPAGANPVEWREFRVADSAEGSRRTLDLICPQELDNSILHASAQHGRCARGTLVRIVCAMFGVGRVTAEIEGEMRAPITRLVSRGLLREEGDYLSPA